MTTNKFFALLAWLLSLTGFAFISESRTLGNGWLFLLGVVFNVASIPFTLKLVWKADLFDGN